LLALKKLPAAYANQQRFLPNPLPLGLSLVTSGFHHFRWKINPEEAQLLADKLIRALAAAALL